MLATSAAKAGKEDGAAGGRSGGGEEGAAGTGGGRRRVSSPGGGRARSRLPARRAAPRARALFFLWLDAGHPLLAISPTFLARARAATPPAFSPRSKTYRRRTLHALRLAARARASCTRSIHTRTPSLRYYGVSFRAHARPPRLAPPAGCCPTTPAARRRCCGAPAYFICSLASCAAHARASINFSGYV